MSNTVSEIALINWNVYPEINIKGLFSNLPLVTSPPWFNEENNWFLLSPSFTAGAAFGLHATTGGGATAAGGGAAPDEWTAPGLAGLA